MLARRLVKQRFSISMDPTENLRSIHRHEEELRIRSLETINKHPEMIDHWRLVSEAMNVIYAFSHDHPHQSDNELILQMLGIRLFNAAAASAKLALSGYYQKAFDQVRDILETYFLVDYLTTYPAKIAEWKAADKRARISHFGPGFVREALDKRDGYTSGARKKIYDLISEYASHASYQGFTLFMNDKNLGEIGPFYDEKKLSTWLQELATRLSHAAVILATDAEGHDLKLLATRAHYLDVVNAWTAKYFPKT
jgi:hypothetical protein